MKYTATKILFFLISVLFGSLVQGQTVSIGQTSYNSITEAIAAAVDGDVIDITGVHTEIINFNDKSIILRGTDPSSDIIQGATDAGLAIDRVITIADPVSAIDVTIENLGIRYGNAAENGGGIAIDKILGKMILKNLVIEQNATAKNGGGLSIAGSNVDVINCSISNNTSVMDGGGIIMASNNGAMGDTDITISQSLVDSNNGRNGGGIYINGNKGFGNDYKINVEIENTTISNNTTTSGTSGAGGGAIWSKCAFWTGDGTTGNVTLRMVHSTVYNNSHAAALKAGIQFTSDPAGANTNFSLYNSIIVSQDDVAIKALNFANTNSTEVINNILGGLNAAPSAASDETKNNSVGKTATFAGLVNTLSDKGGSVQVLALQGGGAAIDYCTVASGISLPASDARGQVRDATPDAGAFEFVNTPPIVENSVSVQNRTTGFGSFTLDMTSTFLDADGDNLTLTAQSSDESVVTVGFSDKILTISEGSVAGSSTITITADDSNGGTASTSFKVNVASTTGKTVSIGSDYFLNISLAVDAANDGDVINISGIHTESVSFNSKSLTLKGTDPTLDIIQAAQSAGVATGRVITIADPESSINVTIENLGIRFGNSAENGGGILVDKILGKITLRNLIIEDNVTAKNGGGISMVGSDADIIECSIINNSSSLDGGGIMLASNNGVTTNSIINILSSLVDSNIGANGGGLYINGNKDFGDNNLINVYVENTTISNNSAISGTSASGGGAIWSKCALWLGDNTTGNVSLTLVHATLFANTHTAAAKNGIQFTSAPAGALTNFSIYNSIVVSQDDVTQKALNFANSNTLDVVNCILGGLNAPPSSIIDDVAKNNSKGQTATFAGIASTLSDEGGKVQVLALSQGANAVDYCSAATSINLPSLDARGKDRDASPDAGAFELVLINSDPTVANEIQDQLLQVGFGTTTLGLTSVFSDLDNDQLQYSQVVVDETVITISFDGANMIISEVGAGSTSVTITANDGNGGSVSDEFSVLVNTAPIVVSTISDQTFTEGFGSSTINLSGIFTDADGNTLTLSYSVANPAVVTAALNGNTLTITEVGLGSTVVTVTANDGNGATVSDDFIVQVNEAPILSADLKNVLLSVYPNPTVSELILTADGYQLNEIHILDLNGKKMSFDSKLQENKTVIDVSHLNPGQYFVIAYMNGDKTITRFVKD